MSHMEWKNDPYRQARGGYARLLAVSCATCGTHLFSYQKDGPGIVKRLYLADSSEAGCQRAFMASSGQYLMKVLHTQWFMNTHPRLDCLLPWSSPLHLCQRRLRLGQPEGHLHSPVQVDGSRQLCTGLLPLTGRGIQRAEAPVAVGLERAHAEFVGQGESLAVVDFRLHNIGGIGVGLDGAELVQRARLIPTFFELPGQVERLVCVLPGLITVALQTTDLAEPCEPAGTTSQRARADVFPDRLLQQDAPLRKASLEHIGMA